MKNVTFVPDTTTELTVNGVPYLVVAGEEVTIPENVYAVYVNCGYTGQVDEPKAKKK